MKKKIVFLITLLFVVVGYTIVSKKDSLKKYQKRRDFTKSPEPSGKKEKPIKKKIFVIQKHDATKLHYDFRLAIEGVLVSWAVPKGPSLNPTEKRLAIPTDDHPLSYAKFEGIIPKGNYGAGTVMVWDTGTYENIKTKDGKIVPMKKCLKNGQIEVFLKGKKLQGGFALVKMKGQEQWLLIKTRDKYASAKKNPVNTQTKSIITDRTMAQIAKDADKIASCK